MKRRGRISIRLIKGDDDDIQEYLSSQRNITDSVKDILRYAMTVFGPGDFEMAFKKEALKHMSNIRPTVNVAHMPHEVDENGDNSDPVLQQDQEKPVAKEQQPDNVDHKDPFETEDAIDDNLWDTDNL